MRAAAIVIALAACGRVGFGARDDAATIDAPGINGPCNVTDVAIGRNHTCMIESGSVWCFGVNGEGQGVPAVEPVNHLLSPTQVPLPAPAVQVAAGRVFSCARLDTGDVYCWGGNVEGALGDGTMMRRTAPVKVALGGESAIDLAAGTYHACIRRASDQAVMCWGLTDHLQAGGPAPTLVAGTLGAKELGIGHKHNCVVDATSQARCWGFGDYGQLADPAAGDRASADLGIGLTGGLTAVAGGGRHSCSVTSAGDVRCWGKFSEGQLAIAPTFGAHSAETGVIDTNVADIQAGADSVCARHYDGTVACWGGMPAGDGTYVVGETPRMSSLANVQKIAVGYYHACAIAAGGELLCWGENLRGELGRGARDHVLLPQPVPLAAAQLSHVATTVCARTTGDEVRCWGSGLTGTLGNGARAGSHDPVVVAHGLTGVSGVVVGQYHGCVWNASTVRCWGYNSHGQAATNLTSLYQTSPATISGISAPTQVGVGHNFSCAIDGAAVRCWGGNDAGQLGNNTMTDSTTPVTVIGLAANKISVGVEYACGIAGGALLCWGRGDSGQLGDGQMVNRSVPTSTGLTQVTDVSAGFRHTCAIASGNLYCWGDNQVGQLGQGDLVGRSSPTQVTLPMPATSVVAGHDGTCVRLLDASVYCWGNNESGQLGDGTFTGADVPLHMANLDGADEIVRSELGGCARTGTSVRCWGASDLLANGDYSTATPGRVAGCL